MRCPISDVIVGLLLIPLLFVSCTVGAAIELVRSIPLLFQGSIEELLPRWTVAILILLFVGVPVAGYLSEKLGRQSLDNADAHIASTPTPESEAHPTKAQSHTADTPTENTPMPDPPSE